VAGVSVVVLTYIGLSQGDATAIGAAIRQIGDGLGAIAMGVGTIVTIASTVYNAYQQSRKVQVANVAAVPGTVVAIPEQHIADALPRNVVGPLDDRPSAGDG
jgi:hypothetical protein